MCIRDSLDVVLNLFPKITLHDVFTGRHALQEAILPAPGGFSVLLAGSGMVESVSYTHLRAHETVLDLVCRLLLEKKKTLQNHLTSRFNST